VHRSGRPVSLLVVPHCGALGLVVVRVCLRSDNFVEIVKRLVTQECIIQVGQFAGNHPIVGVILVDGPASIIPY
jgi:hypothetical protein